jgi:hypothetical protein
MFVIVKILNNMSHLMCRYVTIYLRTKYHMPSSYGSCVIAIKPKVKNSFHTAAICILLHSTKKKNIFSKLRYRTRFQDRRLNVTSVASTSQVCAFAMLLPFVGKECDVGVSSLCQHSSRLRKARNSNHNMRAHLGRVRVHNSNNN